MNNIFFKNLSFELTEIELIKNGFSIKKPFGSKQKLFFWKDIKDISFSKDYNEIIIQNDTVNLIKSNNIGWYELIQNIPLSFTNFDFEYVKSFIELLESCQICGIVAVSSKKCIVCGNIAWNNENPQNKLDFLKDKQLDFFKIHLDNKIRIKNYAKPEHGFKADENWKLYI